MERNQQSTKGEGYARLQLGTGHFSHCNLGLAEGTFALIGRARLFHRGEGPLFVGVIEPAALPEIAARYAGRHFGAAIAVKRHPIDRTSNMKPIDHIPSDT